MERVNGLIDDAVSKGAQVVIGGKAKDTVMQPTIVDGVKPGMRLYPDESFRPIVAVVRVKGIDEAVASVQDEAQMPFGGVKASGYGRFGGKASIDEFTDVRWITIQQAPRHYPI